VVFLLVKKALVIYFLLYLLALRDRKSTGKC
jgi:hypothetical protein